MENAGRGLAALAHERFLGRSAEGKRVNVFAGRGGNGGGALVAARRLHNWGAHVRVYLGIDPDAMQGVPKHQLKLVERIGLEVNAPDAMPEMGWAQVALDGLIGYSLVGNPRGHAATLINAMNDDDAPVVSLDTPSGLDTTTGLAASPSVTADVTMTLALPKAGLRGEGVKGLIGELYLADISVPPELYAEPTLDLKVGHIFSESDIVRLW